MKKELAVIGALLLGGAACAQVAYDVATNSPYVVGSEYIQVGTPPGDQTGATNGMNGGYGFNRWQRGGYGGAMPGYNHIKAVSTSFNMGPAQFGLNATTEAFSGCDARRRMDADMTNGQILSFSMMAGGNGAGNAIVQGWVGAEIRSSSLSNPGRDIISIGHFGGGGDWELSHRNGTVHTGILLNPGERLDVSIKQLGGDWYRVTITPWSGMPQVYDVQGYYDGWSIRTVQFYAFDTAEGDFFVNFLKVANPPITVSGTVNLQDIDGDEAGNEVVIEVRNVGSTIPLETHTVTLGAGGSYTFDSDVAAGTYDVAAKGSNWLRKLNGSVSFPSGGATSNFDLVNGDADPDNEVNLVDGGAISAAFGSTDGDPNWNPNADLNRDGEVNLVDWGILSARFGQAGDE